MRVLEKAESSVLHAANRLPRAFQVKGAGCGQAFKEGAIATIKEYFLSGDGDEVARRLSELSEPGLHHIFVKHLIQVPESCN